jgi:hypothetical protein
VKDFEDNAPHLYKLYIERRDEQREQARTNIAIVYKRIEKSRKLV